MKFKRRSLKSPRLITTRRLKLAEKALQRERDKFPLLADWIAEQQPTALQRLENYQECDIEREENWRRWDAESWRNSRRWLFTLPESDRKELIREWNKSGCPKTPEYFADLISHRIPAANEEGRLKLEQLIKDTQKVRLVLR